MDLGSITHVTCLPSGPIHVSTLGALPVVSAEQSFGLVRCLLSDFRTQFPCTFRILGPFQFTPVTVRATSIINVFAAGGREMGFQDNKGATTTTMSSLLNIRADPVVQALLKPAHDCEMLYRDPGSEIVQLEHWSKDS